MAGAGAEVAVLANATAGRGRLAHVAAELEQKLRDAGFGVTMLAATDRASALDACHAAVTDAPAALVTVGGDGTVHLAVQAVAGTGVPLGVVPVGTGNDFAAAVGLPLRADEAVNAVVASLAAGHRRPMDLAVTSRDQAGDDPVWYATVLSAGLDASINERANRMRWPTGPSRYTLSVLIEILTLHPNRYRLVLDGEETDLPAMLIAVGNTTSYGGGVPICPSAEPADGLLDLTIIEPIGRPTAVRINSLARRGAHVDHPSVRTFRAGRIEIHGPSMHTYADGERGLPLPLTIDCVPGALRLLAPETADGGPTG